MEIEDKNETYPPLINRESVTVSESPKTDVFRVFQWNILADALSFPTDNFCAVPPQCLKWQYRKNLILNQILAADADVICLEEVDHFEDFFLPELKSLGYVGHFLQKNDSPCLKFPGNNGPDGVAVFYRQKQFQMIELINDYLKEESGEKGQQGFLGLVLKYGQSEKYFLIVCSHLKAKKEFAHRRLAQTKSAIEIIESHKVKYNQLPIVWCGDFNGELDEPYYDYIKSSDLDVKSAYVEALQEEMPFTTWKIRPAYEEKRSIDYVWFSKNLIKVCGVLKAMAEEDVPSTRFPSLDHGSDHIVLCVDFTFL